MKRYLYLKICIMKNLILPFLLLPLIVIGQDSKLSGSQSKQLIEKLAGLLKQYDARYDRFQFVADCDFVIFSDSNDTRQGIVNLDGKVLLPREYHIFRQHGSSKFLVVSDTLMGLIDKDIHWIIPLEYDNDIDCLECTDMGSYFGNGYACMAREWAYGAIDTAGNVLVPFQYDSPFGIDRDNDMLYFLNGEEEFDVLTITDFNGKKRIGPYQWIDRFSEGLAGFQKNDKYGFLDTKGKIVIPASYDYTGWKFENGLSLVLKNEKQMLIDKSGKVKHLFNGDYDVLKPLWKYTTFVVKKYHDINFNLDGDYGIVDASGKQLIPIRYQQCCIVNDRFFAMFKEDGSCDIFDKKGTLVSSYQQILELFIEDEEISFFDNDHFVVMKDSLWGIADSNFNLVLPYRYNELYYLGHGFAQVVNADESATLIDLSGKTIIEGPYHYFERVTDQLFKFYTYSPDNYEDMVAGFIDIFGNSTATKADISKMKSWIKR